MPLNAIIFDLDGVITNTAQAHASSWKALFDAYLLSREKEFGEAFVPFEIQQDYVPFVDGKPRYLGVKSFLASRTIELPQGKPEDPPGQDTICALGNRKNHLFQEAIKREGVSIIKGTLPWIHYLKKHGLKVGMATSSKNGPLVLEMAGLTQTFAAKVDGNDIASLGLHGKPNPDLFLECARRLGLSPEQCGVVEDALSGVEAGKAGHFALVIGKVGSNGEQALLKHGADLAVQDLSTLKLSLLEEALHHKISSHG